MKGISVALATYNGARFIGEQLDSLARQTVLPVELVVSDDASQDGTPDIVAAFAAKAPFPVRCERNAERMGYQLNFMRALDLCRAELIAFCDQDDIWLPHKLATCLPLFDNEDVLLSYHNATVVAADLAPIGTLASYAAPHKLNPPGTLGPWKYGLGFTLLFRRKLLAFNDYWPETVNFHNRARRESHDQWFCFLASSLGTVAYIDQPLVLYRQHGANVFGWYESSGLWGKIRGLAGIDLETVRALEEGAGKRAFILERMAKKLGGEERRRADLAAVRYRRLETVHRQRRELYATAKVFGRLSRFAALARIGGYCPEDWRGIGRRALVKDFLRSVVLPTTKEGKAGA